MTAGSGSRLGRQAGGHRRLPGASPSMRAVRSDDITVEVNRPPPRRARPTARRHVQAGRQARRQGRGDLRPGQHQTRQGERRHRGQRASKLIQLEETPAASPATRPDVGQPSRSRPRRPRRRPRRGSPPTTTSATSPTAPGSPAWRRSTRSRWSRVPDLMAAYQQGAIDLEGVQGGPARDDRPLRADGRPGRHPRPAAGPRTPSRSRSGGSTRRGYDSKYAALYWPWIKVFDPATGENVVRPAERPHRRHLGPQRRHPRRAQGAGQRGRSAARSTSRSTSPRASTTCSTRSGINCIRAFPGRGIRVWGARTLSSDPSWRYLNVRRLFNYLEESILNGTQWVGVRAQRRRAVGEDPPHASPRSWSTSGARARCSG